MLKQNGLSMSRNGTYSNYQRMTFLLIMPMVCNLFIMLNGLMLTLCMSPSIFGLVTGYQELSTFVEGLYMYDSLMDINNNARLQVAIKPLAKLLPHILNAIAYYGFHGDTKVNYQEWEIERL